MENLQNEVNLVKSSESKFYKSASHPIENIKKVKEQIEKAKKQEYDACSLLELKTL